MILLIILIIILIFIGKWIKKEMKWEKQFTIADLIEEHGGKCISIKKASVLDHIIYSGRFSNNYASFYNVKYINNKGKEVDCVVKKYFFFAPMMHKDNVMH